MFSLWDVNTIRKSKCYEAPISMMTSWPHLSWWRHQIETFSALLALCAGNSPVPAEFPAQRSVTRSFDVFFDLRPNKRLSKQSRGWWFETPSRLLWRRCNGSGPCTRSRSQLLDPDLPRVKLIPNSSRSSNAYIRISLVQIMVWCSCKIIIHISAIYGKIYHFGNSFQSNLNQNTSFMNKNEFENAV